MTILKIGSRGETVKQVQKALHLLPDGIFGKLTEEAVKDFQRENNLTIDGKVGPATMAKLMVAVTQQHAVPKKSKRRIDEIIVHCTATPEGQDCTIPQIRASHKKRGFSDIGYHYVVFRDGTIHEGRDVNIVGAHCKNHNAHSIGVSYVGGLENKPGVAYEKLKAKDTRTGDQKASLKALLKNLRVLYPNAKIIGHRDTSPDLNGDGLIEPNEWIKACPSFDAKTEYSHI